MKKVLLVAIQITGLMAFSELMNRLAAWTHLPLPGSILGILALFLLLQFRIVKLEWIELGATWLLAELLLFFIPAAVGVMNYIPLLEQDGMRILAVVVLSTLIVMTSSGLLAGALSRRKESRPS
ncbi:MULTISPECIES: CidA/LrgA family holin-like protein [Saccharibacillus]|uniref:CidA/LrgA family holin-like protein n=1 Tax=Saccharibacillus brassicae TaxID=2583377 RepID=A0A4Y6UWQ5_SACBS|nr:CidA/LrgA family holin-like protein [Saccharibacillus brassicae]MWJ30661.1 CidA/LrgA family holin-like protein [Saccharibacillus sp. WB 17]QDH20968.1 CidA/LrgA family holin-like protein [Saccharibacillus brassicae]